MAVAFGKTIASLERAIDLKRIQFAFKRCASRLPSEKEVATLTAFLEAERERIPTSETSEDQVWFSLARVCLNLDETITRE